ncbi:hypothetical protein DVH05_009783 [Phytophthora capsici]|nr:hypothetical protein DVH05_009783 [Phytophthora capsici]
MVAHALFCASRRTGARGIAFNEFLPCLIGDFGTNPTNEKRPIKQENPAKENFTETKVPFLAPPNARWPDYILRTSDNGYGDCNFGHLVRAKDRERLDCYVMVPGGDDPLFICECKHWEEQVDSGSMKNIVEGLNAEYTGRPGRDGQRKRKWNNWDLAFVFCQALVQFQQEQKDAWEFPGTGIVTV